MPLPNQQGLGGDVGSLKPPRVEDWPWLSGSSPTAPSTPKSYIYLPAGWNAGWLAAKAAKSASFGLTGDSELQGTQQNTDILAKRVGRLLLNNLSASIGAAKVAEHFPSCDAAGIVTPWSASGAAPWTYGTATGGAFTNDGFIKGVTATGLGASIETFVTPFACTDFDFVYRDLAAGTITYTLDGGGNQTFLSNGDGTTKRLQLTGLASATHTLVIAGQSVATEISILGATCYYGARAATGLTLANFVCGGQSAANLSAVTGVATSYKTSRATLGPIAALDLLIWALGVNDNSPAVLTDSMTWIIESARNANPNMSVLILGMPNFSTSLSDVGAMFGGSANQAQWYEYLNSLSDVSQANGYGFISIHNRWGARPVANGFINAGSGAGQPHPNDAGHADIASAIQLVL